MSTYQKGSFRGGNIINLNLITCENNIVILSIIQSYLLKWYHTYLNHPGMDIMEASICQNLYWPSIRKTVQKEVTNYHTCQLTKRPNIKYGNYQLTKTSV